MMRLPFCLALAAAVLFPDPGQADLYRRAELSAEAPRLASRLEEIRAAMFLPQHLPPAAAILAEVPVRTPIASGSGDPFGFMAVNGEVVMPISGLKFIEDLTMAYAWRYLRGQRLDVFDEYFAMLRHRPERDWPEGRYRHPLSAFGVPPDAWREDRELAELATSLRNEAWAFILAHEFAHVYFDHPGNRAAPRLSRANEVQADAFAMDWLEYSDTTPMGIYLFFQASVVFYPSAGTFADDVSFRDWQAAEATHPVNTDRLLAIADRMQAWSPRAATEDKILAVRRIGAALRAFAEMLEEPDQQRLLVRRALEGHPDALRSRP